MNKKPIAVFTILFFLAAVNFLKAQTFYQLTALSGTQAFPGRSATVTTYNGLAGLTAACTNPTYRLIGNSGAPYWFNYSFSLPVYQMYIDITGIDGPNADSLKVDINGSSYMLNSSMISMIPVGPACGTSGQISGQYAIAGNAIYGTTAGYLGDPGIIRLSLIPGTPINSLKITAQSGPNGFQYSLYYADTAIVLQKPYIDTLKCPGDSIYLPYYAYTPFNTGNVFTAQLSNASGSFASPTTIGTLSATGSGTVACKLPQNVTPGTGYRVRIVSSSPVRTSADNDSNIHILNGPTAAPLAGSNAPFCAGGTLNLTSTSAGTGVNYSWTGPGSFSSSLQNPLSIINAQPSHSGDYIVTASFASCIAKDTVTVLVKPMPALPTAANNGPLCPGDNLALTASSATAGVGYSWNGPGSYSSAQQNPSILNVNSGHGGIYTVTTSLNGCSTNAPTTVVIKPVPAIPTAGSNTPVCAGGALNLAANSTTPGVSYSWNGPNSFTSILQNPSISPAALTDAGTYNVTATLNGCISAAGSTTVAVNNVSSIGAYPSPNDTICQIAANATFVAVPSNGGSSPQYQWFKNGSLVSGATGLSFPATVIADGDTFYCRMTVLGVCSDPLVLFSNKLGMTVLPPAPPATIAITANPGTPLSPWQTVSFTATPGGNMGSSPQYQWKRNGSNIIGATATSWSANNLADNDEISCVITSSEWCTNPANVESNKIKVNIKTGIDDISDIRYKVYPNPATSELTIEGEAGMQVTILNVLGQEVYKNVLNSNKEVINISQLAPGHYVLQLVGADGSRSVVKVEKG